MNKPLIILSISASIVLQFGCAKPVKRLFKNEYVKRTNNPKVAKSFYKKTPYTIEFSTNINKELKLHYFGCGGYYMSNGKDAILIDPFFSNKRFFTVGLKKISTDTSNVNSALKNLKEEIKSKVNAIYVSHSHYDHLFDVPYIYEMFTDKTKAYIYCSRSGKTMIKNAITDSSKIININDTTISSWNTEGVRYPLNKAESSIRVTPLLAAHAPHLKCYKFYKGECKEVKGYDNVYAKTRAKKWKEGTDFSFLIDFMNEKDSIEFRIVIQSSAAPPKYGWLNKKLLSEYPVNIAIICAASFANTRHYPCGLFANLNPQKVIICHWEDFFIPYYDEKKTIRFTNIKKFIRHLNEVFPYEINGEEMFSMPNPGVDITVKY